MSSGSAEGKETGKKKGVVCVTGASGYVASWIVKLLLLRGYTVKASVRRLNDPNKTQHLLALDGAKDRLHLFEADLLVEGSFDSAVEGCEGVFHTASPVQFSSVDPQTEILAPAVKGTLNILGSCAKVPTIKRVVLTSSMAAVIHSDRAKTPDVVVDESWISDTEMLKESKKWYQLSKTLAEETAWKFAREKGIDMITMNPGFVIGPSLQPNLSETSSMLLDFITGAKTCPNGTMAWIHIKDVANAHIQAFETPSASGRYCLAETVARYAEIVKILNELYPTPYLPDRCSKDEPLTPTYQVSRKKAEGLGIEFIPLKVGLQEMVESLKENKFLS